MLEMLKKYFGNVVCSHKQENQLNLPIYLAKRERYQVSMNGISFVAVRVKRDESFGIIAIKKQLFRYEEQLQCNVVFAYDTVTRAQRDALLRNNIPFISLNPEHIYLPFLGLVLNNNFKREKRTKTDKMMPATQQLFLYMLYSKADFILKSVAAEELGLTRTSITRASEQLLGMGLIEQEKVGKEIRMFRKYEPQQMYEKAKAYLINPVQKKMAVKAEEVEAEWLYAGESALGQYSMLNEPKVPEIAIYKGAMKRTVQEVDIRWEEANAVYVIELWKYNPFLFSKDGKVDPVSLACSLAECEDERVEMAIDEMLEEVQW